LGTADPVTDAHLRTLEQFFHRRGSDVMHEVCPLGDPALGERLRERGYEPVEWSNVLVRALQPASALDAVSDRDVRVRLIRADEHEHWARTLAAGWADVAPGVSDFILELAKVNPHRPNAHCFLAEWREEAIAAASISTFDGVALLAGAATMPAWRKRGAQLALLAHRLRFAEKRGCDLAMMAALPDSASERNAERQGFRALYMRTKWQLPPGNPGPSDPRHG
jgi:GNAT superfamily N-acetyltransferase